MSDDAPNPIYNIWGQRAEQVQPERIDVDEAGVVTCRHFKIGWGQYTVSVPTDPTETTLVAKTQTSWYNRGQSPMPNMTFSEGEMRIPVEDFADLILSRVPAADLADGLLRLPEVRAEFMEHLAERYHGELTEDERRAFLTRVQSSVHKTTLDRAITLLNHIEEAKRTFSSYERWKRAQATHYRQLWNWANDQLLLSEKIPEDERDRMSRSFHERFGAPDKLDEYLYKEQDPIQLESTGPSWHESRDYWRKRLEEIFTAGPEAVAPPASTGEETF